MKTYLRTWPHKVRSDRHNSVYNSKQDSLDADIYSRCVSPIGTFQIHIYVSDMTFRKSTVAGAIPAYLIYIHKCTY